MKWRKENGPVRTRLNKRVLLSTNKTSARQSEQGSAFWRRCDLTVPKIALLSELLLMLPTSKTEIPTLIVGIEMAHSFTTRPIFKQAGSTTQNMNKAGGGDITIKVRVFYASLSRLSRLSPFVPSLSRLSVCLVGSHLGFRLVHPFWCLKSKGGEGCSQQEFRKPVSFGFFKQG